MENTKFDKQPIAGCLSFLKNNIMLVMGMVIAFSLCMYCIMGVCGFSLFPDEFGYWAPAAAILGYDWSQIASVGSYYSYGYSILLVPILFLFKGTIQTIHAAIILNLIMQCVSIPLIYSILTFLYPSEHKNSRQIAAAIAVLYPAWVYYSQTTMSESLLCFLFILSTFLFMQFIKKPGVLRGFFLAIVLMYCYLVHMRCIGIIAAGILTVIIWSVTRRKHRKRIGKKVWLLLLVIIALFVASFTIKEIVTSKIYSDAPDFVLGWNSYASVPERLLRIITGGGLVVLFKDLAGKLLYSELATYGIGFFGIYSLVAGIFGNKRERKCQNPYDERADHTIEVKTLRIFILLASVAQFMVALIYLNGASSAENNRLDIFLHGRYHDFVLPLLIGIGLLEMMSTKKMLIKAVCNYAVIIVCYFIARGVIIDKADTFNNVIGHFMIGISYPLKHLPNGELTLYLLVELILGTCTIFGVILLVGLYKKYGNIAFMIPIIVLQIVFSIHSFNYYIMPQQAYIYGDILLGSQLKEVREQYPDRQIVHVFDGDREYIDLVQFEDRDAKIDVINREFEPADITPYINGDTILILSPYAPELEMAKEYYDNYWMIGHLILLYND